jgi:hypothetical protein
MKTNLKTLKLIKCQSGSIRIALTYKDQPNEYESFWVIGKDEIDYTINRLRGIEKTSFIIDDGNYHLKFGIDGILCTDLSDNPVLRHYVTFPGELLADKLETINQWIYQEDWKREEENVLIVNPSLIDEYAFAYRNRSKVIYHDSEDYSIKNIVIRLLRDPLTKDYFKRQLKSFVRQVGEINGKLHLMLDSYSEKDSLYPSLYFWLETKDGRQYYNGGIINHSKEPMIADYSIHT